MSEENDDLEGIEEAMLEATQSILAEARTGQATYTTELMVAVLNHAKRSPKVAFVVVEVGDGLGQEEMEAFCEDAQAHLEPKETISIETYNVAELMTAIHALTADTDGGEE